MMRALTMLLLACAATPAGAQHAGHVPPVAPAPAPPPTASCAPEHAAMGHCTLAPATTLAPPPAANAACTPEHAAMGHCTLAPAPWPAPPPAATAACTPEHAAMGHCTLPPAAAQADPHAGHGASAGPPLAPPPRAALSGPAHAADLRFGGEAMRRARDALRREHGGMRASKLLVDRLEWRGARGRDHYLLDAQGWHGGDIDKLWIKADIDGARGAKPEVEAQALWSHAINPWFDLQAGVRADAGRGPDRSHLVLGVQGLAPYWLEVEGALFLSHKGELTARAEAEYDLRITQQLIVQPSIELHLSTQDIEELGIGSGLTSAELGLRLRYQVGQQFAPYVGLSLERAFGATRRLRRAEGESASGPGFVAGLRFWF